ncbi:response regulator [Flavobacterium sp.]
MKQTGISIFYVDDDVDDLDFFKESAEEINHMVYTFEEGDKLLHALHNPPPMANIIFVDLNMPIKSGFDVLREIKASPETANIPVVVFTTSNNPNDIELSRKCGANLYVRKPTSANVLKNAISVIVSIDWKSFVPSETEFVYKF